MIEIRLHGRGGQGAVTAAELLAQAAFDDGHWAQAFPAFGVERRGAPILAFVRVADGPIHTRTQVYRPDYVIVQDATLLDAVDVAAGLKPEGTVLLNTEEPPEAVKLDGEARVVTVPATRIALEELGRPIMNTTLLGAFAGMSGLISLEAVMRRIAARFPGPLGEKNMAAARRAFELMLALSRTPEQSERGGEGKESR